MLSDVVTTSELDLAGSLVMVFADLIDLKSSLFTDLVSSIGTVVDTALRWF